MQIFRSLSITFDHLFSFLFIYISRMIFMNVYNGNKMKFYILFKMCYGHNESDISAGKESLRKVSEEWVGRDRVKRMRDRDLGRK